jgi:hypothetical protein
VEDYDGPGDLEIDQIVEGAFIMKEAGVEQLIAAGKSSPLGEREYWRRVLMDHPEGPQLSDEDFEEVYRGMMGDE